MDNALRGKPGTLSAKFPMNRPHSVSRSAACRRAQNNARAGALHFTQRKLLTLCCTGLRLVCVSTSNLTITCINSPAAYLRVPRAKAYRPEILGTASVELQRLMVFLHAAASISPTGLFAARVGNTVAVLCYSKDSVHQSNSRGQCAQTLPHEAGHAAYWFFPVSFSQTKSL